MADFLAAIGLSVRASQLPATTFLPGILIEHGELVVDKARLQLPAADALLPQLYASTRAIPNFVTASAR